MASNGRKVENVCRLCAGESKSGVIIYSSEGLHLCLEEKIAQCLRIEVSEEDMLPKRVCCPCRLRLEESYRFAEQANKVQNTLKLLIQMSNVQKHAFSRNEHNIVKSEDEMEIKDETEDLPSDVTVECDFQEQMISKMVTGRDDYNNTARVSPSLSENKTSNEMSETKFQQSSEQLMQHKTRPRKASSDLIAKKMHRKCMHNVSSLSKPSPLSTLSYGEKKMVYRRKGKTEHEVEEEVQNKSDDHKTNENEQNLISDTGIIDKAYKSGSTKGAEEVKEDEEGKEDEKECKDSAREEWKAHWGIKCNQCDQIFPFRSQFDKHYQNSYQKKPVYTCLYCSKTMEKYSTFRSHCYRHVTEGRYRCEHCQKGFSLRSMLHVHILAKHTTVKPFICEECGKGFVTRPGLNIHLKKHKTDEKVEYPCPDCGKILHTRGGLTAHQNVHKLGRRFMCDVCGKTFTQKVNMLQHVKHHTGERPFACEKCGKCFAEKSHLNRHYSFHSEKRPFQCPVCQKMYKTERCLKVHAMVHSEARPYVCTYCNKGFLSTTKLKQHHNIHTGERPYTCKFCERTFTNYPNWLKHTRRRHKDHTGNTSVGNLCQQSSLNSQGHRLQQHETQENVLDDSVDNEQVAEESSFSETSPQLMGVCMVPSNNTSSTNILHQYPPNGHVLSLPVRQNQQPLPLSSHALTEQPSFALSQVFSGQMIPMHVSHAQNILPL